MMDVDNKGVMVVGKGECVERNSEEQATFDWNHLGRVVGTILQNRSLNVDLDKVHYFLFKVSQPRVVIKVAQPIWGIRNPVTTDKK